MTKANWIGKQMVAPLDLCRLYDLEPGQVVTISSDLGRAAYGKSTVMVVHKDRAFACFESKLRVPKGLKQKRPFE